MSKAIRALVKSGGRAVLEIPCFALLRRGIMTVEAKSEFQFVQRISGETGLRFLGDGGEEEFRASGERDTFFILGSGSSVNLVNDRGFRVIRRGFSIGINAWPLHPFVPDVYAYEPVNDQKSDHFQTLSMLNHPDVLERSPAVLILRPRNPLENSQLSQIPHELSGRTFLYGRVTPATRIASNLLADLYSYFRIAGGINGLTVLLDSGATIVRLASLGLLLGYKKIVFVGVDLNNSRYFWEENPVYLARRNLTSFVSGQTMDIHETMIAENRPFVVTEMIGSLSNIAAQLFGAKFFVASQDSALAQYLPHFSLDG